MIFYLKNMKNLEKFLDLFTISEKEEKKEIKEDDVMLEYDITKISVKKLVKVLNYLDLEHYKSITPIHLLNTNDSSSIHALLTQHTNLINLVKNNKKNKKYFFRLAKALLLKNNLNSFMSVYNGLKSIFTSKKLKEYYDYDDTNFIRKECYSDKVIIPPIKFFLNELSSHVNQSKNFYKCVELFVKIQDTKPVKINKKRVKRVKEILSSQPKNISLKNDFFDFLIFLVE